MIKNLKKINNVVIKQKGDVKIEHVNQSKISFVIAIVMSLLFLILFHKKHEKINTQIISNGLLVFEIPNFLLLKTFSYFYDLRHFRQIQDSLIQSNLSLVSRITHLQSVQDEISTIDKTLLDQSDLVNYVVAKTISANKNLEYIVLNKGKNHNVHDYSIILQNNNVAGFVIKALDNISYAIPINSQNFKIPAKINFTTMDEQGNPVENTIFGMAEGSYSELYFRFSDQAIDPSLIGSIVLTSSESDLIIPNLYIGLLQKDKHGNYIIKNKVLQSQSSYNTFVIAYKTSESINKSEIESQFNQIIDSDSI